MAATSTGGSRVLIIGGGFAGLECARTLAGDSRFSVTLVDRTNHHLFQPLLYQVATASLAAPDIARSIRQILADAPNVTVLMDEIIALDPVAKTAIGASGTRYEFDYLLLAAGARTSFFGKTAWAQHTLGLKSLADAQAVRRTVLSNLERAELCNDEAERKRLMTVAIVGGGPTGVELAGAFADLVHRSLKSNFRRIDTSKLRVVLIEGSARVLEAFDEDQSEYARQRLKTLGVEVWTGMRVDDVQHGRLHFTDGSQLEAEAIIWAAGVEANPLTAYRDKVWERSLPPSAYKYRDDNPAEGTAADWTRTFPHPLGVHHPDTAQTSLRSRAASAAAALRQSAPATRKA